MVRSLFKYVLSHLGVLCKTTVRNVGFSLFVFLILDLERRHETWTL